LICKPGAVLHKFPILIISTSEISYHTDKIINTLMSHYKNLLEKYIFFPFSKGGVHLLSTHTHTHKVSCQTIGENCRVCASRHLHTCQISWRSAKLSRNKRAVHPPPG